MRAAIKLFLIMILVFSSLKAEAVVYNSSQIKDIVVKQVMENYKAYTDAELSIQVITLPFQNLYLPNGQVSFVVKPSMDKFMARDLEKVYVYVDGKFEKTFNAPVVVKAYKDVLIASKFINIGQQINSNNAIIKRLEISNTFGYQLNPEALNSEIMTKKAFREGEVIDKRFVKQRPDILRNSNVTLYFNSNNLTVSIEAIALSDGVIGDNICLMSKDYKKTYKGRIIGENKVLVKI